MDEFKNYVRPVVGYGSLLKTFALRFTSKYFSHILSEVNNRNKYQPKM